MVLEGIITKLGETLTNPVSYFLLVIIFSFFLFLLMKFLEIPKFYAGITSVLLTTFLLEIGLKELFYYLGAPITFGTYTVSLPIFGTQSLGTGVMLMRLLDFIFNFGVFREVGIPYLEAFNQTITNQTITNQTAIKSLEMGKTILMYPPPSFEFKVFVALYVSIDSIIEFLFMGMVFWGILIVLMDFLNSDTRNAKIYAYLLAAVPVIAYTVYISNPIFEYRQAMPQLQKVMYFMGHADTTSLVIFLSTLIFSILLVTEVIAVSVSIFLSTGAKTFKPSWESKVWQVNVQGMGFLYTLSFAIMYALHQYPWFVFFPAIVLYTLFKNLSSGAIDVVKEHQDRQEMKDFLQTVSGKKKSQNTASGGINTMVLVALLVLALVFGYLFLSELGWV